MSRTQAATDDSEHAARIFNPGLHQSDDEVAAQFVVRQHEFGVVGEVLRDNIDTPSCQHLLVAAPEGRGKTMLLARMAAELRGNRELSQHLRPVRFMEENHEIHGIAGFWLETLYQLAKEVAADCPEYAREFSRSHDALASRWRDAHIKDVTLAAVLDAANRLGRRLVLMVENLQSLCEIEDGDFGWQLRKVLQTEPQIILLASAPSRFAGLDDPREAFFEFFRIVPLHPLTTDECRRLWTAANGQELTEREIRPLEILTGGSPRLIAAAAAFARRRPVRRLAEELAALVDGHTECFRSRLESLPKGERRVYAALLDLWQPSSAGEAADRARLDVRIASTMLGRLVDRGAVTAEPRGGGRRRLYAASEPLSSIYYKLRREREEAKDVAALIRFMAVFYQVNGTGSAAGQLRQDALAETADHAGIGPAPAGTHGAAKVRRAGAGGGRRFGECAEGRPAGPRQTADWRASGMRSLALTARGESGPAIDAFRAAYAEFPPDCETALGEMLQLVPELIAAGAAEGELAGVLDGTEAKSVALRPLIAALRRRAGETVRAPSEVLQVAADLERHIAERVSAGAGPSLSAGTVGGRANRGATGDRVQ